VTPQEAAGKARQALLDWLDALIASAPAQYQPGGQFVRDQIAANSQLPADLVGTALSALGDAFLAGDFGPATGSDADVV